MATPQTLTNAEFIQAGKEFAANNGDEAWRNLCQAWGMDESYSQRVKEIFVAGLAMGFVEALKMIRDSEGNDNDMVCCCGRELNGSHDHNTCGPPIPRNK